MLFVLGYPARAYIVRARIYRRGLCCSCWDIPQGPMLFVLGCPAEVYVVRARMSGRGLCCSC